MREISEKGENGNGGGAYVAGGEFQIVDGTVRNCTANNGGGVRDANNALEIVQQLIGKAEEREFSSWYEGKPPQGEDVVPLWEVTIRVFRSHRHVSCYQVEYRRHNGCPAQATDAMMRTYRAVKQALKNGRKALEAEREQKRKKRGANS